mgnify:CR=1 FL=1
MEKGKLYIVQTRPVTTMVQTARSAKNETSEIKTAQTPILTGSGSSPGIGTGFVKILKSPKEIEKIKKLGFKDIFGYGEFLLSSAVNINFLPIVFYNNIVTSSILVDKYNEGLSKTSLGENDADSEPSNAL